MQINSNFPVHSNFGQLPSKAIVPVDHEKAQSQPSFSLPVSPMSSFEQAAKEQGSRFSKIESLDRLAQDAINTYQMNQSLAADNPRNYLIGVDVFA